MAKRHKKGHKGGSKKSMRHLRRGKHGVGRKGGMEHLFGRAEHRGARKRTRRRK
jgi:hypothetical protein